MTQRIFMYMHCRRCLESMPAGQSAETWARLNAGWTKEGFQVWCVRHNVNVFDGHLDGHKLRQLPDDYEGDTPSSMH